MAIVYTQRQWVATMTVIQGSGLSTTSTLVIPNPQLRLDLSWAKLFHGSVLRPYAAFESWDAAADDPTAYPTGNWSLNFYSENPIVWNVWEGQQRQSTAMTATLTSPDTAVWHYKPRPERMG